MKKDLFILAVLLHASLVQLRAQTLTLEVHNVKQPQGYLYAALYDSQENFLKKPVAAFRVEARDTTVVIPCQGLPAGEYALSLFHDINGNGKLDTGHFGIPQEPYGFSNDAQGTMGPPSYKQCRFAFRKDTILTVHLL